MRQSNCKGEVFPALSSLGAKADRVITWALNGFESILGTYPSLGLRTTLQSSGPKSMQDLLTEKACISPTRLTDTSASKSAILKETNFSEADWSGSNGEHVRAFNTKAKSQVGIVDGQGGFSRLHLLET